MSRGYAWLDESVEHSDEDSARAAALAKIWSRLHDAEEQQSFRRQMEIEDGSYYRGPDLESCETCGGDGKLGVDGPRTRRSDLTHVEWRVGIDCPNPHCVDGLDEAPLKEAERAERERQAELSLEIEIVEEKLSRIGARMMRPYEHWNEDERLMEWMERER